MADHLRAWRVATATCPHCVTLDATEKAACGPCAGTGDLMRVLLEDQRRRGREEALTALRGLHGAVTDAGLYLRDLPMPDVRSEAGW